MANSREPMRGPSEIELDPSYVPDFLVQLRSHNDEACERAENILAKMMDYTDQASTILKWREKLRLSVAETPSDETFFQDKQPASIAKRLLDDDMVL